MRKWMTRTTTLDSVTVYAETWDRDMVRAPSEIQFWQRLYDAAPDERYRRGYGKRLSHAQLKLGALETLPNW